VDLHLTTAQSVEHRQHYSKMKGREVFKSAGRELSGAAREIPEHQRLTADQITCAIPHQAYRRTIETLSEDLEFPLERFVINLDHYGNTSAASIPLAPDEARHAGRFHAGDIPLRLAFGAGLTYGSTLIRW
jgi:3-oxoacyl-[acyl-carrier-protein] synthase-3